MIPATCSRAPAEASSAGSSDGEASFDGLEADEPGVDNSALDVPAFEQLLDESVSLFEPAPDSSAPGEMLASQRLARGHRIASSGHVEPFSGRSELDEPPLDRLACDELGLDQSAPDVPAVDPSVPDEPLFSSSTPGESSFDRSLYGEPVLERQHSTMHVASV